MIEVTGPKRRKSGPFVPANAIRKPDAAAASNFAARHFAAKRAGFLLREYARQQVSSTDSVPSAESGLTMGEAVEDLVSIDEIVEISSIDEPPITNGISPDDVARQVAEAEQRGREAGQAELVAALDQAIAALDAAGRAVNEAHGNLERRLIVPLAQASFHIGSELARQVLTDAGGLQRYLEAVTAALQPGGVESDTTASAAALEVRLNPEDLAVLERASIRPASLTLIADPLVPRAGAIASSENKVVDDRFENRVRFAKEAVLAAAADLLREAPS